MHMYMHVLIYTFVNKSSRLLPTYIILLYDYIEQVTCSSFLLLQLLQLALNEG